MAAVLPTAKIGQSGPEIPRLGLGLMGLSIAYGSPKPDNERFAFLDTAYSLGETFWDSSDIYGDNEDLLGQWFKVNPEKRDKIFLATKFGLVRTAAKAGIDSSPEYAINACNRSLSRLGVPSIDLYYLHRLDGKTPIEKTVTAMAQLKSEGKIKYLGLSECSAETLRRAHKVHPITAVQMEYSLFSLEIESPQYKLLEAARELGVAVVAYSPLGRGFLTGAIKSPDDFEDGDFRKYVPRFSTENFDKNLELVKEIQGLSKQKGIEPSQLALAWLLAQGLDIFPIPGTTSVNRLKENLDSLNVQLSAEEEKQIRDVAEAAEVAGGRYPEASSNGLFADSPPL